MKKFSQILGTLFVASMLFLTACSKKPMRLPDADQTGVGIDPNSIAVDPLSVGTGLEARNLPPGATEDEFTIRGLMEPVYFQLDRSAVQPGERAKIEAAVKYLNENPDKRMLLEGRCDWRGTAEYNLGLGDRRANAVKRYLETLGIPASRLEILSKGSTEAVQSGGEAEWSKDRRVEFVVLKQ